MTKKIDVHTFDQHTPTTKVLVISTTKLLQDEEGVQILNEWKDLRQWDSKLTIKWPS